MATLRALAIANCKRRARQFQSKDTTQRTYQKLTPDVVLDLLEDMRGPNRHKGRALLEMLSTRPWDIRATAHPGGTAPTAPLHINIEVTGQRQFHLDCKVKEDEGIYLVDVGQNGK